MVYSDEKKINQKKKKEREHAALVDIQALDKALKNIHWKFYGMTIAKLFTLRMVGNQKCMQFLKVVLFADTK